MSKIRAVGKLISECLDRCRASGYPLATLMRFLDEMRSNGLPEADVQRVDAIMRRILKDILVPETPTVDLSESPTDVDDNDSTRVIEN